MKSRLPFIDLAAQNSLLREEIDRAIADVVDAAAFVGGPALSAFESEFARFCESRFCVGVASGTDALELALVALGVGPGDEVLTTPNTFIATTEAIMATGAWPVLVDVDPSSGLMDPGFLEAATGPRTRAILPVHVHGTPVDMDAVAEVAEAHDLVVVEDAAQAHGARWRGRRVGTLADAACFSFYPTKNLGGFGDGGAVVCQDEELAGKVRMLSNHGRTDRFEHAVVGRNSRLDALQATVLSVKLSRLEEWNARRDALAKRYRELLARAVPSDLVTPAVVPPAAEPVFHLFVVRVSEGRDDLFAYLKSDGIQCGIHYSLPVHRQPAYRDLLPPGGLQGADRWSEQTLSLPLYPEMADSDIERVCEAVARWAKKRKKAVFISP